MAYRVQGVRLFGLRIWNSSGSGLLNLAEFRVRAKGLGLFLCKHLRFKVSCTVRSPLSVRAA